MSKARSGDFFEDRRSGRTIAHLAPRTVMEGHRAHHAAACPTRFASRPSDGFARACGLLRNPASSAAQRC